jgi:hypothetical protein
MKPASSNRCCRRRLETTRMSMQEKIVALAVTVLVLAVAVAVLL